MFKSLDPAKANGTEGLYFKTFNYGFSQKARVFVPGKPLKSSLMFADKARAYLSEAPFR
jgi:hypothetical protein